jgi:hypothetical protein
MLQQSQGTDEQVKPRPTLERPARRLCESDKFEAKYHEIGSYAKRSQALDGRMAITQAEEVEHCHWNPKKGVSKTAPGGRQISITSKNTAAVTNIVHAHA